MNATARRPSAPRLLLVEGNDALRRSLQLLLTGQGYQVHAFSRAARALADPLAITASHLVIDYILPETDGMEALTLLRAHGWKGRAVLITGSYSQGLRRSALRAGFAAILLKPFPDASLIEALRGDDG
ncbi:response regulator [Sphingomonas sp.]|uniref:response regulator n=1 Tax=Sphingomonas sp. TaxID=28214 RepID=UPI002EDB84CF